MKRSLLLALMVAACGGGREATELQLPVVSDATRIAPVTTDLGYTVTITAARAAIRDLELTIEGEEHEVGAVARVIGAGELPHPGHAGGGDVTGELRGELIVTWTDDGASLGTATLLTGRYQGLNFTFRRAGDSDGLAPGDPLVGHTFHIEATVTRDAVTWTADILLDMEPDTQLMGAPFAQEITDTSTETIGLQLAPVDPFENDTLFDGIDFAALDDGSGAIVIAPGDTAHNQLRRLFGAHDHYFVQIR